ncbi:DUF3467 domain-containing protein [Candidatus Falkowbacteria bacterium CG10_big_fil_rev_8_21_14_0_10_37_14]|uniref:DUF3467 domain-containing protein n=1 Tax=Candidatus Falkowbacteria bacterium CG10_big_fil_rev_8_21_14_0_10_37_14 TaxID=1974561 RepID=A0A2M6WSK9_9BACT|nr:DUF3467 domain-containing protein [Candidatus Falkowbacteria bacterium]PIT95803.1 MAG: DUF3467 domain-containing protein [Candidatus Falkowbacteria bacterium CG10_big_fil_rev_8_21_14_0_10_37_14]
MANEPQGLKIADNFSGAEYTNLANISHNKEEFHIVFANVMSPSGRVVAKLISSPAHFKRMIMAMNENLKRYEDAFGNIQEADLMIEKEIGFKE